MDNFPNYPPDVQQQVLDGPALTPPDGVLPNFDDPPNKNAEAVAVAVVCMLLVATTGLLRIYSGVFVVKKVHFEEYLYLASVAFYAGFLWAYFSFYQTPGFFVHQWNVRVRDMIHVQYVLSVMPLMYGGLMLLSKPAILLEWTRIFVPYGQRNTFFWIGRLLMLLNVLWYGSCIIATVLACVPREKVWHTWVPGKCIDRKKLDICTAAFNFSMDIFILLLPQRVIWKLQMTKNRKIGISIVFSMGLIACISAAGRIYSTVTLQYSSDKASGDTTGTLSTTYLWALAEETCVLMVFCIPAIPKAFSGVRQGFLGAIVRSLRSWTRIPSFGSRKPSPAEENTWPPCHVGTIPSGWSGKYHKEEAEGPSLSLERIHLVRSTASAGETGITYAPDRGHQVLPPADGRGTLKTTEFGRREHDVSKSFNGPYTRDVEDLYLGPQHRWMQQ